MLICIPDVLSKDEVAEFRRIMDVAEWEDGRSTEPPRGDPGDARRPGPLFFLDAEHGTGPQVRSMIFDLDTAIQSLTERLGRDDPDAVKLTGIYHNLIRHWAEI